MSSKEPNRKPRQNRPTDPFGGPSNRGNGVSLGFALVAIIIFLALQWTNGNLGGLLGNNASAPTSAPQTVRQPTPTREATADEESPAAQATLAPTETPAATSTAQPRGAQTPRATVQPTPTANAPPAARASNLPTIHYDSLPPEAQETIALIEQDGPFPFSRDGIAFENRERLLPRQSTGYYREYTVITPGSRDRGARRIVTGEAGEMYYTDDHYESFREIIWE